MHADLSSRLPVIGADPGKSEGRSDLSRRSFRALRWNYFGAFARMGAQFLVGVALARILGPEPFGIVAIAWIVLGIGNLFADFGLSSALVQQKDISSRDIRHVFALQCSVGIFLSGILAVAAPFIAEYFRRPDAAPVLQAMSLLFAIQALGQTAAALLKRRLDFRRAQGASVVSYVIGYAAVGIPLAFYGAGVWSLVAAQLVQASMCSLLLYRAAPHSLIPSWRVEGGSLFKFGAKVTGSNLTSWAISNLDSVIVGRSFGMLSLGLYSRAFNLVATPMNALVSSLQGVLFAASARAQDDQASLGRAYLAALGVIGFICLPMFLAIASVPQTVVMGVYGSEWSGAVVLLTPLALAMPLNALLAVGGPMMMGMGKAGREMGVQLISLAVLAPCLWLASSYSIEAVAWVTLLVYALRFVLVTGLVLRLVKAGWNDVLVVLKGPLVIATAAAAGAFLFDSSLESGAWSHPLRLAGVASASMLASAMAFAIGRRSLVAPAVMWYVGPLAARLPVALRRFFGV
jgi:PST family polysaccharide transporter